MSKLFSLVSHRYRRYLLYPLLSLFVALSVGIWSPTPSQALPWADLILRGVQVIQLSSVSDKQEVQLGKQINQELVGRQVRLYRNPAINSYVEQIGKKLAAQTTRSNIPFTFQVVQDNSINAFATMGGFVYVHTGLLAAADNEAELASVIGHEIGHIVGRHALEQMRQAAIAGGVATAAGLDRSAAVQIGVDLALQRPNSRKDEYEADSLGLQTMERAGYAQSAMVSFMEKLLKQGGSGPTFLSRHPATRDRITRLRKAIDPQNGNAGTGLDNAAYRAKIQPLL